MLRVAAVQFATGTDVEANLATSVRMVDSAAAEGAELVVLPEFCNHLSWYRDHEHALEVSCDLDGPFAEALADRARTHRIYLKSNLTVRRPGGTITGTNLLHGPDGSLLGVADKLVLMGGERLHMSEAEELGDVVTTTHGVLGLYSCMDGVIFEVPRLLAVRGAQVLLNSLNSFALDEAALHIPVRAAENRVWVVAANKVGTLIPEADLESVSAQLGVPAHRLRGAGESQIVGPDGTVVAQAPREGEAVVVADIDVTLADDKIRPGGTHIVNARRQLAYAPLTEPGDGLGGPPGDAEVKVAVITPVGVGHAGVEECVTAVRNAVADGALMVVLPELCWTADGTSTDVAVDGQLSAQLMARLADVAGNSHIALSVVSSDGLEGVVVGAQGVVHRQRPLHLSARHAWSTVCADRIDVVQLPWGRLALLVGEDAAFPESARLATLAGAEVLACPMTVLEPWERQTGLLERAAENRVNLIAASRDVGAGSGLVVALDSDFTLWTTWSTPFAGTINMPSVIAADGPVTMAVVRPACAANKQLSRGTDLVAGRPWKLAGPLVQS